ncbi:MAG: hypothetical protein Q7T55_10905 [Solirubrobacteraceae bacterium]|nr:hypothetical protein [Solirubrobacteraceae bacterium]
MQRLLPALAAFALVFAGVGAAILVFASRDGSSLEQQERAPAKAITGPDGLPVGNVLIEYRRERDGIRIGQLAERLGAIDTEPTRAAGQAIVAKEVDTGEGVTAHTGSADLQVAKATDPLLAAFVREHLGRSGP